jgi:hypothetical protein
MFSREFSGVLRRKLHVGSARAGKSTRHTGVVISPDVLAAIRPGESTYADVVRLCGRPEEETEEQGASPRRSLVYRGRRTMPDRRLNLGWVATVNGWNAEEHEVVVTLDGDRVSDVRSLVKRTRTAGRG